MLYVKLKYRIIWGYKFKLFQSKNHWLGDLYRSNLFLYNDFVPLSMTYGYSFFTADKKPGFGYYSVDAFYSFYHYFLIFFLVVFFFLVSSSFRCLYFPKVWFVNNSEYL